MSSEKLLGQDLASEDFEHSSHEFIHPGKGIKWNFGSLGASRSAQCFTSIILTAIVSLGFLCGYLLPHKNYRSVDLHPHCGDLATRYEWRTLSPQEQGKYLDAVDCLRTRPSRLGQNHTLYDDFPYLHVQVGAYSHNMTEFLPWHRWFLHAFEQALRNECGYDGHLSYWDWTLDWQDLTAAPVWSNESFGTNGDPEVGEELLGGYCVVDGRFAHHVVPFVKELNRPHCLSRGFANETTRRELGNACCPSTLARIILQNDYEAFFEALEMGPHNAIPETIRGDFLIFTAPSDPVFYLHHAQLDRIWRAWQDRDPEVRLRASDTDAFSSMANGIPLDNVLPYGGFVPDVTVRDVLDTESSPLCYRY